MALHPRRTIAMVGVADEFQGVSTLRQTQAGIGLTWNRRVEQMTCLRCPLERKRDEYRQCSENE